MTDHQWLAELHKSIWAFWPRDRFGFRRPYEARVLTDDERVKLLTIMDTDPGLILEPHNAVMGFGFGVGISALPTYPGMPAEFLCDVTNAHLGEGKRFEDGWQLFSPYVFSERNLQHWRFHHGQEPNRDKSYYDY